MTKLANLLGAIQPSATLAITEKAKRLRSEGHEVIPFAAGEPDFDPPPHIGEAADKAFRDGYSKYTPTAGIVPLREAICEFVQKQTGRMYNINQVMASGGAKMVIFLAMQAVLDPDDEVLIPKPYWVSYPDQAAINRAKPVFIPCDDNFTLDLQALEDLISPKTKLIILNSPSNPSGKVLSKNELKAIADILDRHPKIHIISDEIYDRLVYGSTVAQSIVDIAPHLGDRTMIVNGVSKSFAMTGWRLGWGIGPEDWIKAMAKLQGQMISSPSSITQYAGVAALTGPQDFFGRWLDLFRERRDFMHSKLTQLPGVNCRLPEGAFYLFADFRELCEQEIGKGRQGDDPALAAFLLDAAKVAAVPGSAFGMKGYLRFSFATSMESIKEGMNRLDKIFNQAS